MVLRAKWSYSRERKRTHSARHGGLNLTEVGVKRSELPSKQSAHREKLSEDVSVDDLVIARNLWSLKGIYEAFNLVGLKQNKPQRDEQRIKSVFRDEKQILKGTVQPKIIDIFPLTCS